MWLDAHRLTNDPADPDLDSFQTLEVYIACTGPASGAFFFQASTSENDPLTSGFRPPASVFRLPPHE
jgi:hypothetical protein